MEDIAPELLEKIRALFLEQFGDDAPSADTYAAAGDYAERVGDALATAFQMCLSGDVLPDGRMYWNIADRVVRPLLEEDWQLCTGAAAGVQRALNKAAGIGLVAQAPDPDKGRIDGILNEICAAEQYEDKAWMLDEPVRTFSRAAVDETLRRNVEFQSKAGLRPRIVRTAERGCCEWCTKWAGTYDYPDVPDNVYKRHANCRCSVEYDPGGGKRQDVWTKRWTDEQERGILEQRQAVGLKSNEMQRRRIGSQGQEIIDKPTYNKLTRDFLRRGGIIIRGEEAERHLKQQNAYAAYITGGNAAYIRDEATISDVLEEMFHADQDWSGRFGHELTAEVLIRREIEAQEYLLSMIERYKIPSKETEVTKKNLEQYIMALNEVLERDGT